MATSYAYSAEPRKSSTNQTSEVSNQGSIGSVGFREQTNSRSSVKQFCGPLSGERKKYFTQKYGQHQMLLIRKRLAVEEWLDTNLRRLYSVGPDDLYECEIDMDEVLDLDTTEEQRSFIREKLTNVRKSKTLIEDFIDQVIDKAESL